MAPFIVRVIAALKKAKASVAINVTAHKCHEIMTLACWDTKISRDRGLFMQEAHERQMATIPWFLGRAVSRVIAAKKP